MHGYTSYSMTSVSTPPDTAAAQSAITLQQQASHMDAHDNDAALHTASASASASAPDTETSPRSTSCVHSWWMWLHWQELVVVSDRAALLQTHRCGG